MALSQQDILDALERLKQKDRPYLHPADYHAFMPKAIPNVPQKADSSLYEARMQAILDQSNTRTLTAQIRGQNREDFRQLREAQRALAQARNRLHSARNASGGTVRGHGGGINLNIGVSGAAGRPGHYGPLRGAGVGRNLAHFDWNGRRAGGGLTLNRSVGGRFVGFLRALASTGYQIHSLGSYANRNIAGTSSKSLHAYGLAIDINPAQNPVTYGRPVSNLPRGVGKLAAKYGLVWGGNWNGPKFDTMHFSVPFGGRK